MQIFFLVYANPISISTPSPTQNTRSCEKVGRGSQSCQKSDQRGRSPTRNCSSTLGLSIALNPQYHKQQWYNKQDNK